MVGTDFRRFGFVKDLAFHYHAKLKYTLFLSSDRQLRKGCANSQHRIPGLRLPRRSYVCDVRRSSL